MQSLKKKNKQKNPTRLFWNSTVNFSFKDNLRLNLRILQCTSLDYNLIINKNLKGINILVYLEIPLHFICLHCTNFKKVKAVILFKCDIG